MPRYTLVILLSLFSVLALPQTYIWYEGQDADSLLNILPDQEKEERVNTLNALAYSIYLDDSVAARQYAEEALRLSEALEYKAGMAEALQNIGYFYYIQGDFARTLQYYHKALSLFEELDDSYKVGRLYEEIAATHYYSNNIEKTLEYGYKGLSIYKEQTGEDNMVGSASDTLRLFRRLAFVYSENGLGRRDEVLQMYISSYKAIRTFDYDTADLLLNMFQLGVQYHQSGQNDSGMYYLRQAIALPESDPNVKNLKYKCLALMGLIYHSEGKYDSAYAKYTTCIDYYRNNGFLYMATLNCNRLAKLYFSVHDLKNADKYFRQAENLFTEMIERNSWYRYDSLKQIVSYGPELYLPMPRTVYKEMIWNLGRWLYAGLYRISLQEGRTSDALNYLTAFGAAKDTMHVIDLHRESMELQTRYESERKDQQIIDLAKENELKEARLRSNRIILFGLAGFISVIIFLAIILIRQNRLRERQNNIIFQQKLFRSQMNPHFIFNSLSSIHHFMINEEPAVAASYLSRFSKLIRAILRGSVEEYTSLNTEIVMIENYLELQKLRFQDKFDFNIEVDEEIDTETTNIPAMIIQPFIENAIEHGIKNKDSKGKITVTFKLKDGVLAIVVEDDGIGREKAMDLLKKNNAGHKSLAVSLIRDRIRILNKTQRRKISLNILDLEDDQGEPMGTKVVLEVPLL